MPPRRQMSSILSGVRRKALFPRVPADRVLSFGSLWRWRVGTSETLPRKALTCGVADLGWQQGRVYFLAFLNPLRGQPVHALTARLASLCHLDESNGATRLITAHAADRGVPVWFPAGCVRMPS